MPHDESKSLLPNFIRGKNYELSAADFFIKETGSHVYSVGYFKMTSTSYFGPVPYGSSPDDCSWKILL